MQDARQSGERHDLSEGSCPNANRPATWHFRHVVQVVVAYPYRGRPVGR
jgi:hypothetical protein